MLKAVVLCTRPGLTPSPPEDLNRKKGKAASSRRTPKSEVAQSRGYFEG